MVESDYLENYLDAIKNPLSELRQTFDAELDFLKKHLSNDCLVLDLGCGIGRPTIDLAKYSKKIVGIDSDSRMLGIASKEAEEKDVSNLEFLEKDVLKTGFPDGSFGVTYATYNLIGSLDNDKGAIQDLVNEMARITKKGGKIINITWKDDDFTTEFLKKYYPSIDIDILEISDDATKTSKGEFKRFTRDELRGYYECAGLNEIEFCDIGLVWIAVVGKK
jgi:ubiquinone/menaquinone biosynthesis C-methylase UbiE